MAKDIPLRFKLRFVLQYGTVTPGKDKYIFKADPTKNCPILQMEDKSKWNIIIEVYDAIKSYT
jgi:starvation-inducible outer membrane lipoprotein